uniref:RNase H type-1 domain-containing protein n=1 Tax=Cannabis sativa TaxID=3483 RepID=A0A803PEM3_CANSA
MLIGKNAQDGKFTMKRAYAESMKFAVGQRSKKWAMIWDSRLHLRASMTLWRNLSGAIPVREKLCFLTVKGCLLCGSEVESIKHLFWECPFARALWFSGPFPVGCRNVGNQDLSDIVCEIGEQFNEEERWKFLTFVGCLFETIWYSRNTIIFKSNQVDILQERHKMLQRLEDLLSIQSSEQMSVNTMKVSAEDIWKIPISTQGLLITDASWKDGKAGIAVGCQDRQTGKWYWSAKRIEAESAMEAEASGIHWAIQLSLECGFRSIAIAIDALLLVQAMANRKLPPCWKTRAITVKIWSMIEEFLNCTFVHLNRTDNMQADKLAKSVRIDFISCTKGHQNPVLQPLELQSSSFPLSRNSHQNSDLDFEIMAHKARKSKTSQDLAVTFEAKLIESKVRSIGSYVSEVLKSCGIKYKQGCRVRSVIKGEFSYFLPERVAQEEGYNTSEPSQIGTWGLEHIRARAVLPLKDYFKEFRNYLGVAPFHLACPTRKQGAGGFYYLTTHTNDQRIIVRLPNKNKFKDEFFWTSCLSPISIIAFGIILTRRPVPNSEIEKRHRILLGLPFGLRAADFLLHENNLKACALLGSRQSTGDFKVLKYLDWQQVLVPADEEDRNYIARTHYINNTTPRKLKMMPPEVINLVLANGLPLANHPDWDISPLNPFNLFMITGSREFSCYYSSSSSSIEYDMDFEILISTSGSKKGKKRGIVLETYSRTNLELLKRLKKSTVKFSSSQPEKVLLEPSCP